jgi:ribosomal protein S18 acetylase RimI-like enzyme
MDAERIVIREATSKDAEGIIDVLKRTKLSREIWEGDEKWTKKALRKTLATENYVLLVAEVNQRIVGFIDYVIYPSFWECTYQGLINDLFVHEVFQGKGVGGKLIEAVVQRADASGLGELHVSTGWENARARRLYAKHGFTEEQPLLERACVFLNSRVF